MTLILMVDPQKSLLKLNSYKNLRMQWLFLMIVCQFLICNSSILSEL